MEHDIKSILGYVGAAVIIMGLLLFAGEPTNTLSGAATTTNSWTPWYDTDTPSGSGDYETISSIKKAHPGELCNTPIDIECRTTTGRAAEETGEVVVCGVNQGLICKNTNQADEHCINYEVRFRCEATE